jgi:hypothetical protein
MDVDHKSIAIGWIHGCRKTKPIATLVEGNSEDLEHRNTPVGWKLEKCRLHLVWRAYSDRVAVPSLFDAELLGEILDGSLLNVVGEEQLGSALFDEAHGIVGRLQRIWDAVDEALLVAANHL